MLQDGNLQGCLDALHKSMGLSTDLEDISGDADVLGAIGDTYTDLGDLEKAAEVWHCQLYMQVRKCCSTTLVLRAWVGAPCPYAWGSDGQIGPLYLCGSSLGCLADKGNHTKATFVRTPVVPFHVFTTQGFW